MLWYDLIHDMLHAMICNDVFYAKIWHTLLYDIYVMIWYMIRYRIIDMPWCLIWYHLIRWYIMMYDMLC